VDIPAPVVPHLLRALQGRLAVDDPALGPYGLRSGQVRSFLTHQCPQPPATERRKSWDGSPVGGAGRPPHGPRRGDPTGRDQAVHVRMVSQETGPGVPHTQHSEQTAAVEWVRGKREERGRRGTAQDVVEILWMTTDNRPSLVGHGEDDVTGGDRQEFLTPLCQPGCGVVGVAWGATAMATRVVGLGLLPPVVTRPQVSVRAGQVSGCHESPGNSPDTQDIGIAATGHPRDGHWRGDCPTRPSFDRNSPEADRNGLKCSPGGGALAWRPCDVVEQREPDSKARWPTHTCRKGAYG
jgi:hypothetical protein